MSEQPEQPTNVDLKTQLEPKDFEGKSLMIMMPCYGGQMIAETASRLIDLNTLCSYFGIKLQCKFIMNESLIQRARNYLAHYFEISEFTHGMFIDADVVFDPRDVLHLLYLSDDEHPIIGGLYPKKHILWPRVDKAAKMDGFLDSPAKLADFGGDFVFNPASRGEIEIFKPVEVLEIGTGFMMLNKTALNTYKEAYPNYEYKPDHNHSKDFNGSKLITAYFHVDFDRPETTGGETNRLLSEDYFFCQMSRKAGSKIWACPWMQLSHVGTYVYRGSVQALAAMEQFQNQGPAIATTQSDVPDIDLTGVNNAS
jgi:hypothetical protein